MTQRGQIAHVPRIVLLGNDDDDGDHRILFDAIRARGGNARRVHPDELVVEVRADGTRFHAGGAPLHLDLVLGWVYEDYLILGMNQLETCRLAGVAVVNSALTLLRGQSKYLNSALLHGAGVAHLPVLWGKDEQTLARWAQGEGFPLVTKPLMSSRGRGMRLLESVSDARAHAGELRPGPDHYYVQPYLHGGSRDIRVLCVNYRAVAAVERLAPADTWISNAPGNTRRAIEITDDVRELAQRAAESMDALWAGVDIARDERTGALCVYEVNTCPTCADTFAAIGAEPVALHELASFLVAAGRDFAAARRDWRPAGASTVAGR